MSGINCILRDFKSIPDDPEKAEIIIKGISKLFTERRTDSSTELLISLAFGENGITSFVMNVLTSERHRHNILSVFELIEYLLVNYEKFCIPYVEEVKQMCLDVAKSNASAKVKENSVKLLKSVFAPAFIVVLDLSKIIAIASYLKERVPPTVQSQLFSVVGIVFEKAPEFSEKEKDEFLAFFLYTIGNVKNSKTNAATAGCFEGINGYLVNFLPNEEQLAEIYSRLKQYSILKYDRGRRITERSALKVIIRHYRHFATFIYQDITHWQRVLEEWLNKTGEDRQIGFDALVAVYQAVAYLFETSNSQCSSEKLNDLVEELLVSLGLSFRVASMIAVTELISTGYVKENLANRAFNLIMKSVGKAEGGNSSYLCVNLECMAKYLTKSENIKVDHLIHLQRMAVALIDGYAKMDSYSRPRSLVALEKSFYYLDRCGNQKLDEYIAGIVYQGLIRSCSHQIWTDVELVKEMIDVEMVSHKSFLPLWLYMMNLSSSYTAVENADTKIVVADKLFNEYITSFLRINRKLDLRIQIKDPHVTDPEVAREAVRPDDFKVFINNVNLFVGVSEGIEDLQMMKKWLTPIFTEMVTSSYRSPLISGYYKVITACLRVADKIQFFSESSESKKCFATLQRFLNDVSIRVGHYKGELQISCFENLLSAPACLIKPFVMELVPIFKVILRVGSGYLPLLKDCISTMERWYMELPKDSIEFLLRNILPYFDIFLQSRERWTFEEAEVKWKPLKVRGQVRKIHVHEAESELVSIQKKFLLFLGKLDQDVCKHLIRPTDDEDETEGEEHGKRLTYDLPVIDTTLRIHMDELIPRVIELAMSSTDRRTRIPACEFLHSLVLLTMGNMKQMNGELNETFRKIVSVCLVLGCDSDLVVFQIFEPLMMQMVHYFADRERDFSPILVNCLMESASHPFNSSLRDFAAKLIREFAEWSIKSHASAEMDEMPANLKAILRSLYSFSVHPDHNKRRGAAVAFNNIYSFIKDETDILKTHWFMLCYCFMECLNMCTFYDDTSHIINAVENIKISLTEESCNHRTKVPPGFDSNSQDSIIEWIFNRCFHSNSNVRKLSMSLIEVLLKISKCFKSVSEFVHTHKKVLHMTIRYLKEDADEDDYLQWLQYNSTVFNYYGWLLLHKAVTETDLRKVGVELVVGLFLDNIRTYIPKFQTEAVKASVIVHMIEFLNTCVSRGIVWHKRKILELVKKCLFQPSEYKLELCDFQNREKLNKAFTEIIQTLSTEVTKEDIENFCDISVYESEVSSLGKRLRSKESLSGMVDLLNGLKTIHSLGLWNWGFHRVVLGDDVMKLILNSLFVERHRRWSAIVIEPSEKIFLNDFLKFAIDIGVSLDTVVNVFKDQEEITEDETFRKTTKGRYIMENFKGVLFDYLMADPESSLDCLISSTPTHALDIVRSMVKHKSNAEKFVSVLYRKWHTLKRPSDSKAVLLSLIRDMCEVDPNALAKEKHICLWIFDIMRSAGTSEELEIIFDLVPFLSDVDEEANDGLSSSLRVYFDNQKFFSSKLDKSDPKLTMAYKSLLNAFSRTRSLPILQYIIIILTKYSTLMEESELDRIFTGINEGNGKITDKHVKKLLSFLYEKVFIDDGTAVFKVFLNKLLEKCEVKPAWNFFLDILDDLLQVLSHGELYRKNLALEIIQSCVIRAKSEDMENLSNRKKEVFRNVILICIKKPPDSSPEESELRRKYACFCFNILCAVVATKSDDPKQYECLIFKDEFPYLQYMINRDKVWALRMDFDELPKRRKVFMALRKTITKERQIMLGKTLKSIQYLQEESLFDSSLEEDVTRFDFSLSFIQAPKSRAYNTEESQFHVELEMDDLNKHECMVTLLGVIEYMVETKIVPQNSQSVPFWLSSLLRRMKSFDSSENEKIFLLKLMYNMDEYLKPYALFVIPELLNTLLDVFEDKPINYLVVDLIKMIVNWRLDLTCLGVRLKAAVTRLALYIVDQSDSYRKDIIKSIMELEKLIIETCKDNMNVQDLSAKALEKLKMGTSTGNSSLNYLNFHFCSILLANSILPWTKDKEEEFLRLVLHHCKCNEKIGKLAGEVCGLTLQHLKTHQNFDLYLQMVRDKIRHDSSTNDTTLLYAIHKHFPDIIYPYSSILQNATWSAHGLFKVQNLEMILSYVKSLENLENNMFGSTIHTFLEDMLSSDDNEVLVLSLNIISVILDKALCDKKISVAVEKALSCADSKMTDVRRFIYKISKKIFEEWNDRFSVYLNEDAIHQCKAILLNGMNDSDTSLRNECVEFWYNKIQKSKLTEHFAGILCEVYTPETENGFLNFAARMMIQSSIKSPDCGKSIFEHPLVQNSSFRKRNILKTTQHSTISPMFAQTLVSQLSQPGVLQSLSSAPSQSNLLLQTLLFQGTAEKEEVPSLTKGITNRFVRDPKLAEMYFAKKRLQKKEDSEKKERVNRTNKHVDILGEYCDGDFPNIQVTHEDLLRPLEVLTMNDPQIGRYFLTSLYDGCAAKMTDADAYGKIRQLIQQVMEKSVSCDPAVVAFFFHILLHCNGRIEADTDAIMKFAKTSGSLSVGSLLIEEMIIRKELDEAFHARRRKITPEEKRWLNLAEICKCMKEFDILRAILLEKLEVVGDAAEAIRSESALDWLNASKLYESVLKHSLESVRNDFYVDAYLQCLARLSDWEKLSTYVQKTYKHEDLWSSARLCENVLPWYMRSEIMRSLQSNNADAAIEFVKKIQNDPDKETHLKKYFMEEFIIAHFSNWHLEWAKYYIQQMGLNFLSAWSHWNKWSNNLRMTKLQELQIMSELEQCVMALTNKDETSGSLAHNWSRKQPRASDDLMLWDMKLTCRGQFLSMLRSSHPVVDVEEIQKSLVLAELDLVKSGIEQLNIGLSEAYLIRVEKRLESCRDHNLRLMHTYYRSSLEIFKGQYSYSSKDERLKKLIESSNCLEKEMSDIMDMDVEGRDLFFYECNMALSTVMSVLQSDIDNVSEKALRQIATLLKTSTGSLKECLKSRELGYLEKAKNGIEKTDEELLSKTYLEIAKFYRKHVSYSKEMAKCLFRSMSLCNPDARHLFCCLLNERALALEWATDSELRAACGEIPTWMFLKWTNQILANLDSEMFPFLKDILLRMVQSYPNAVRHSFTFSMDNYKYLNEEYGPLCRHFVDRLSKTLLMDASDKYFITALSFIAPPDLIFKYDLERILNELTQCRPDWKCVVEIVQDLHNRMYGAEYKHFRGPIFGGMMGLKPELELLIDLQHDKTLWKEKITHLMSTIPKTNTDNVTLKSFSPWLHGFHTINQNTKLEMPGQYSGEHKPILKAHVTISSFRYSVLVMNSKCRPVRVSILGNNGREYKFLVKFGEDLRQDQRIQQVFGHMNHVMRVQSHNKPVYIDTYTVIPLKCNLGIIEWVNNTTSLYELITKVNPNVRVAMEKVQREHLEFLSQGDRISNPITVHLNGYAKITRDRAIARFNERVHSFEWDLLRKAFWRLSLYPEQFVCLRRNFAVSQAVIYIAHWLIGIGDRHLDNTLVSTKTGRALGIDFGCAFGFATESLTPPELIPFRLTPQIVNLMKPLGECGLIKETMVQCLKSLRHERCMLLATLEVFALEPALDWQKKARKDQKERSGGSKATPKWSPRQKIAMVKEKLEGVNPVKIFSDDLVAGHSHSPYLSKYLEVLRGDENRLKFDRLTEKEQVEHLIELATDCHVLSKTYVGWNPWL